MSKNENEIIFFDIDGPLVKGLAQEALIFYLVRNGIMSFQDFLKLIGGITLYKLKLLRNPKKLFELGIRYARGKSEEEVALIMETFLDQFLKTHLLAEGKRIIEDHQKAGRRVVLLSSIVEPLVRGIGKYLNVHDIAGTQLDIENGHYTGRILNHINYGGGKVVRAKQFLEYYNTSWAQSWGYADHESDMELLMHVAHPFAVNASPTVQHLVTERGGAVLTYSETI